MKKPSTMPKSFFISFFFSSSLSLPRLYSSFLSGNRRTCEEDFCEQAFFPAVYAFFYYL